MSRTALVTGGSGGIGSAIVRELAEYGWDIAIHYFQNREKAEELMEQLKALPVRCICVQADISDEQAVDTMFTKIEGELGPVSALINNAGIDRPDFFMNKKTEDFHRVMDINVLGAWHCARRAYKNMMDMESGKIVNIASTDGINTYYPVNIDYDASKAALISLTHNLAVQFAPYVNVNCVAPGFIGTENELEGYDAEFLKQETEKILKKRYGRPEEVAHTVRFLVSEEAEFINNTVIRIDGGQMGSI